MKKKYIQPTTKLYNVGVHQMLCVSPNDVTETMDYDATDPSNADSNLGKEDGFEWDW